MAFRSPAHVTLAAALALFSAACDSLPDPRPPAVRVEADTRPPRRDLTILAVGDINLGRQVGKQILSGKADAPFDGCRAQVTSADIAFANLESQLSDQRGVTEGGSNLVFTGPPAGAGAVARAGFDVVSTANNHAWDFGERAMRETIANLDGAGVAHAGTGATLDDAYKPVFVERDGWRIAFIAVTSVFNSTFETSPARNFVAWADTDRVTQSIAEARAGGADLVFVSHHGGVEYSPNPTEATKAFARACIDAGADGFIGHHPHVVQAMEWYHDKPIFYSLGNFLFKQFDPWTDRGLAVRMTIHDGPAPIGVELVTVAVGLRPTFLDGAEGKPLLDRLAGLSGGATATRPPGAS